MNQLPAWLIQLYNVFFIALDSQGMPWELAMAAALEIVLGIWIAIRSAFGG